jgi:hypothetical protein
MTISIILAMMIAQFAGPRNITLADKILMNHVPAAYCTQGC